MSRTIRTQVAIVGAGPAGLTLSCLLAEAGIESVVLENRSRHYVEGRIRAGVLEHSTAEVLDTMGVGERMRREGIMHHGIHLQFAGERHRIPLSELADGRSIVVYGQTEVVKDLIQARLDGGLALRFNVAEVSVHDVETDRPRVRFSDNGERFELACDAIAGCDGFHGVCRPAIADKLKTFSREYQFGWLGILAAVAPSSDELVYAHHERGFALLSLRSPQRSRLYLQCAADERLEDWSDARIWDELQRRVALDGWTLEEGPVLEKGITGMRSFVTEPMQHARLFLAGDAAHIVPPTGAKGLNLAVADVTMLAEGLIEFLANGSERGLASYSARSLRRVWRAEQFSYWMTSTLHRLGDDPFDEQIQLSQLRYLISSEAAARSLAENYVGLPIEHFTPLAGVRPTPDP
jgi:p-hydroxybenzoate 3-monooxygenase